MSTKKQLVIDLTDYCDSPFEQQDLDHIKEIVEEALLQDYDIRVTKVEVKEAK